MYRVLVMGAGKIGSLISFLLSRSNHYQVHLADEVPDNPHIKRILPLPNLNVLQLDANDKAAVSQFIVKEKIQAVISSLPYFCNESIAQVAAEQNIHYFDLTEDVETTHHIERLAKNANNAFVPQCGLAPGFISIVAHHLMLHFHELDTVKMRVGALPEAPSNALQYALTWSTDGLINEYDNPCEAVLDGNEVLLMPLEGLEEITVNGMKYEAFNTSGGVGSLAKMYEGKVKNLSYKTIRYPGHCEKIRFLMEDLRLKHDRVTLKKIFENALPRTEQDVVIVYVAVSGKQNGVLLEEHYVKKFYPKILDNVRWTAIQLTTASGLCAVVDIVLTNPEQFKGFVRQEQFNYHDFLTNPFGEYYR